VDSRAGERVSATEPGPRQLHVIPELRKQYRRLAVEFDAVADIPLRVWQQKWPPGRGASLDAFSRLLARELPLRPLKRR
jgi:hypothetical protein